MRKKISLLDIAKEGGYEASLITTYAVNFPVYEQLIIRKLVSGGCRYNILLADQNQLAAAHNSEELRPQLAGVAYTLLPVRMAGSFHPKIWLFAGKKKGALLVGSHNATLAGLGYNRELSTLVELTPDADEELDGAYRDAWNAIVTWVRGCEGQVPEIVCEAVYRFEEFARPYLRPSRPDPAVRFYAQGVDDESLLDAVRADFAGEAKRIAVLGPYLDSRLEFIRTLQRLWSSAKLVAGLTPEALASDDIFRLRAISCVDSRKIGPGKHEGFVHAKALYIEGRGSGGLLAVGSANPSAPAWTSVGSGQNAEAVLVWRGAHAREHAEALGIAKLFDLPRLGLDEIELRPAPTTEIGTTTEGHVLVGVAAIDSESRSIDLILPPNARAARYALRSSSDALLHEGRLSTGAGNAVCIRIPEEIILSAIRRVEVHLSDGRILSAWVHNCDEIDGLASVSAKTRLRKALASLTADEGNLAEVLQAVEKVIFEDDQELVVHGPTARRQAKRKTSEQDDIQPETFAVDAGSIVRRRGRVRALKSGDLAYLIDILIRRLGIESASNAESPDRLGRSEEEQVGAENNLPEPTGQVPPQTVSDSDLAKLVGKKIKRLISKLSEYLERTPADNQHAPATVARIIAVLALIRELRRIESLPRWRTARLQLVPDEPLIELFDLAIECLLGEKKMLLQKLEEVTQVKTEEALQARALLAWLAWDIGDEYTEEFPLSLEVEDKEDRLTANVALFALFPSIAADEEELAAVRESLALTRPVTVARQQRQESWLNRHAELGRTWHKLLGKPLKDVSRDARLKLGSIAVVTTDVERRLRIVTELAGGHVGLSTVGNIVRFQRDRVVALSA